MSASCLDDLFAVVLLALLWQEPTLARALLASRDSSVEVLQRAFFKEVQAVNLRCPNPGGGLAAAGGIDDTGGGGAATTGGGAAVAVGGA